MHLQLPMCPPVLCHYRGGGTVHPRGRTQHYCLWLDSVEEGLPAKVVCCSYPRHPCDSPGVSVVTVMSVSV